MPFSHEPSELSERGSRNYLSGLAAEESVVRKYQARGATLIARRWRGTSGEIDLIFSKDRMLIFVEVKKSRSFAEAAARLTAAQISRVIAAAEEFAARGRGGSRAVIRIDAALVDEAGAVDVIENISVM